MAYFLMNGYARVQAEDIDRMFIDNAMQLAGKSGRLRANVKTWLDFIDRNRAAWEKAKQDAEKTSFHTTLPRWAAEVLGIPLPILAAYCDGGQLGKNEQGIGCRMGGTYAFCFVDVAGRRCYEESGLVQVYETNGIGSYDAIGEGVTNNFSEMMAMIRMLRTLPAGYAGDVYTDSMVTMQRVFGKNPKRWENMALSLPEYVINLIPHLLEQHGVIICTLLAGHGDEVPGDLDRGYTVNKRGNELPNSIHNVHCDKLCNAVKDRYLAIATYQDNSAPKTKPVIDSPERMAQTIM